MLISVTRRAPQVCYTVMSLNDIIGKSLILVSLRRLTEISVDRLLALNLGLNYKQVVSHGRTQALVICYWIFGISISFLNRFFEFGATRYNRKGLLGVDLFVFGNLSLLLRVDLCMPSPSSVSFARPCSPRTAAE